FAQKVLSLENHEMVKAQVFHPGHEIGECQVVEGQMVKLRLKTVVASKSSQRHARTDEADRIVGKEPGAIPAELSAEPPLLHPRRGGAVIAFQEFAIPVDTGILLEQT